MSIIIKGIEMPTCCDDCFALDDHGDYPYCLISRDQRGYTFRTDISTMPSCPFIEVPPHGRLIDADAFVGQFTPDELYYRAEEAKKEYDEHKLTLREIRENIVCQPTIIEAEET